ncbi:PKD domain-containing protein [Hymenobacter gummosus]|uniref:PKD domain-containing protein n=1 Tax=Hymenobacter gummosus TaxID=1776032 RepID=A0A431TZX1_9BACT|nr:PKD domain-containing protein [Hymenobacter gummosus]RTQ48417.1 PKD domain-containing protein [Hymenobacter gummosus]
MHTITQLRRTLSAVAGGCMAGLLACLPFHNAQAGAGEPPLAARAGAVASPSEPHWQFVENRNQWPGRVRYAVDLPMGKLYLEKGRLTHSLYDVATADELQHHPGKAATGRVKAHSYAVSFEGASEQAELLASGKAVTQRNYFLGDDPQKWATKVPAFAEVRYQKLYPGTDLRLYSRADELEYDFELAAGADPGRIRLRYDGVESLRVGPDGTLRIATSVGEVREKRPVAYQLVDGQRQPVPCEFQVDKQTVSFRLPKGYNRRLPLVIDPVLVYSSYSGSTGNNYGYTATYDSVGNLYAGGVVFNPGFPVTPGAYDVSFTTGTDMGILKFNPAAATGPASLLYATYIGGSGADHPHSMVVDHQNNLIVMGSSSGSFPVTSSSYDNTYNSGAADIVLCKLNSTGSTLLGSTYIGGSGNDGQISGALDKNYGDDYRGDVIVDRLGYIYLASVTRSANFPSNLGFQRSLSGASDAVVAKFTPTLGGLEWSTYLGGTGEEAAYSLQVDSLRNVIVSGGTSSPNLPGTAGALYSSSRGGTDGFVARIAADGSTLQRATFLGTSSYDQAYFVQLDRAANVYVLGQTEGAYPVTPNVYSNSGARLFLHKLNYALTTTLFSTTLGASGGSTVNMSPTAFLIDNCGQVLLSAWGGSFTLGSVTNAPTTPDAIQRTTTGGSFYLMQLSRNAGRLVYGSFFGTSSPHVDGGTSRFDKRGIIYQSMCVSGGMPTTPNAFSNSNRSFFNNGAFKMDILQLRADFVQSNSPTGPRIQNGCAPFQVFFRPGTQVGNSLRWSFGDGATSTQMGTVTHTYNAPGRYVVTLTVLDTTACLQSKTATDTVVVYGVPAAAAGPDQAICPGGSAQLSAAVGGIAGSTYTWTTAAGTSIGTGQSVTVSPTVTTNYFLVVGAPGGCSRRDTVQVRVATTPQLQVSYQRQVFTNRPVTFTNTTVTPGATTYAWNFGDGQTAAEASPTHTYTAPGRYQIRLRATYGTGCTVEQVFEIEVRRFDLPNVITPNGDGQNDSFRPFVSFESVSIEVFNRWGKKVFTQPNYTGAWGTDNVPAGVYYYQLKAQSGETWKGWVEVVR